MMTTLGVVTAALVLLTAAPASAKSTTDHKPAQLAYALDPRTGVVTVAIGGFCDDMTESVTVTAFAAQPAEYNVVYGAEANGQTTYTCNGPSDPVGSFDATLSMPTSYGHLHPGPALLGIGGVICVWVDADRTEDFCYGGSSSSPGRLVVKLRPS